MHTHTNTHMHTHTNTHMHTHTNTHMQAYTYKHTHTNTHKCMHTHTHRRAEQRSEAATTVSEYHLSLPAGKGAHHSIWAIEVIQNSCIHNYICADDATPTHPQLTSIQHMMFVSTPS